MKARLPKGFGGAPGNQKDLMRQAQKMQEDLAKTQSEIENREFTASAGGGVVEVKMNGKKELTALVLKPEIVDPEDIEMLQDVIMAAINQVSREIEDTTNEEMGKITGSINIPGMPSLF